MKKNCVMVFGHTSPAAKAYLEYSWVPVGRRLDLPIPLGQNIVAETDEVDTDIARTQVYFLIDGDVGTDNWDLPPAPKGVSVVSAIIYVSRDVAVATQYFSDGTSVADTRALTKGTRSRQE